jgi:Pyridoxamine 5'-phosphate oxidase
MTPVRRKLTRNLLLVLAAAALTAGVVIAVTTSGPAQLGDGASREAILAVVKANGYPHLTNVMYVWDEQQRIARVSTTADRVKGRILQRSPRLL